MIVQEQKKAEKWKDQSPGVNVKGPEGPYNERLMGKI